MLSACSFTAIWYDDERVSLLWRRAVSQCSFGTVGSMSALMHILVRLRRQTPLDVAGVALSEVATSSASMLLLCVDMLTALAIILSVNFNWLTPQAFFVSDVQ